MGLFKSITKAAALPVQAIVAPKAAVRTVKENWVPLRDTAETAGVLAGNYFLPGSSVLTSHLTSQGSQDQLNSPLGMLGQLGTGFGGYSAGNLSNYGSLMNTLGLGGVGSSMGIPGAVAGGGTVGDMAAMYQAAYPSLSAGEAMAMAESASASGMTASQLAGSMYSSGSLTASQLSNISPSLSANALGSYGIDTVVGGAKGLGNTLGLSNLFDGGAKIPGQTGGYGIPGYGGGSDTARTLADIISAKYAYDAAKERTDLMREQAGKYEAMGAPYRQRLSDLYTSPESYLSSMEVQKPVQMGTDILARSLSMGGNPVASGNALQQLQDYSSGKLYSALGSEKDRLAGFGGLAGYNAAAPQSAQNAIGAGYAQKGEALYGARNVLNDIFGERMYGV